MKKSSQSKALSLALGMSLLASAAATLPAFAADTTNGLFQLSEATPLQIAQDKDAKTSCGAGSCGSKTKTDAKKCASKTKKHHKCASKSCGSKGNTTKTPDNTTTAPAQ